MSTNDLVQLLNDDRRIEKATKEAQLICNIAEGQSQILIQGMDREIRDSSSRRRRAMVRECFRTCGA